MSSTWLETAPVGLEKLRAVIVVDRDAAGEARGSARRQQLAMVAYSKPLRIRWKRRWQRDRALRRRVWTGAVASVMLIALCVVPLWTAGAKSAPQTLARADVPSATSRAAQSRHAATLSASTGLATPVSPSQPPSGLSVRRRVQRAELWLRVGSGRGDREARALLESALAEVPGDAHAQAALAEACLRLRDAECARNAVGVARTVRPWRGGYRSLSRRIEASFEGAPGR